MILTHELKLKENLISMQQRTLWACEVLYYLHHYINCFLSQLGFFLSILIAAHKGGRTC